MSNEPAGLTKREWMATQIMLALIRKKPYSITVHGSDEDVALKERSARGAVHYADALLRELSRPNP